MSLLISLLIMISQASFPDIEIPTPYATMEVESMEIIPADIVPRSDIYNFLATAVAEVNTLPDDLSDVNGVNIVPDESATQLISYSKWLLSPATLNEIVSPKFSPIAVNVYILLMLYVVGFSTWLTVKMVTTLIKFVQYIVSWLLRIIPFVG